MINLFGWQFSLRVRLQKKTLPLPVNSVLQEKMLKTYSQFNEDIFLRQLFEGTNNGCYVDIGANNPVKLNNTKKFYDIGWSGINVEPNPRLHRLFCECRPRDINVNSGVSDAAGEMKFFEIEPDCYSTFDVKAANAVKYSSSRKIKAELDISITTINEIFKMCNKPVDFLSVDTEGFDYKVLSVNDWKINRPRVIIVELNHDENNQVYNLLVKQKYDLILYNGTNGIFASEEFQAAYLTKE